MSDVFDERKSRVSAWFHSLRDRIVSAFEALEDGPGADRFARGAPCRFEIRETRRKVDGGQDGGGGRMSVMRGGRIFEKVGVNVSTVHGRLGEAAREAMASRGVPGMEKDARFWASGVSLVAHMRNPHTPAAHMNTRMFWTPHAWWFGGGADLNPCIEYEEDTKAFHAALRACCDRHSPEYHDRFKAWADEYFLVRHRGRSRGVGGVFFDDLNTGDWEADFAFTRDVGRSFLPAFLGVVEARRSLSWTEDDREAQLVHRGLYVEYNLLYDRGTRFGLATGHDADAVLMSLPPVAKWP